MINRILIRIKTVQLLYSYLLVQKPFSLESQPSSPTKEKRFAYNIYLDTIYLFDELAKRTKGKNDSLPLLKSSFIRRLENDETFKVLKNKYVSGNYLFSGIESELSDEIKSSLLFRELQDKKIDSSKKDFIWEDIFKAIISPFPAYNDIIMSQQGYSPSGIERTKGMMEETFRNFYSSRGNVEDALKTLSFSMEKARELYIRLLALPVELTRLRTDQLETNRHKYLAGIEDLHPNMKFVNNKLPSLIEDNETFKEYTEKTGLSWRGEDPELLERLLKSIMQSAIYEEYMSNPVSDLHDDIEFWKEIFRNIIFQNLDFLEYMEGKSVFWNDDLEITGTFVLKTLKRFEDPETESIAVMPMYKDEEDARFGAELFRNVADNCEEYRSLIDDALIEDKWESDRLAFMDVIIIMTALAEILNFPKIPLVASINEYIEIAKSYSSSKSGSFVHGLLSSIIKKLQENGELKKA